ncbi:MAG: hypothetical protein CVU38_08445 [Chloroflexi bacterium HGW-Chloroflexi-1]|nr:MAG: hypothetical protein CVU38_08445 [Chloroflexi bacterium HGW-Chloroflexi-1]
MADKDTLYHELLDALRAGGCPLCRLGRKASDSYLDALIYEGVTDPDLREKLRDARGPCCRHAWRMAAQRGSVLGTAIVYRDVVNTLIKALEAQTPSRSRWLGGGSALAERLAPSRECPACRLEAEAVKRAAKTLLKHLKSPEIAAGYVVAGGLCLPHFQIVLAQAGTGAQDVLARWQADALSPLRDELDELIRKHHYRFAGEAIGETEADAWTRAVAAVVGMREV